MARGRVIWWERDTGGNPVGKQNTNPILDTRHYEEKSANGEVT